MNKKKSNVSVALLIFIAVFGITNIPNNYANIGGESIFWFIALLIYFVPISLIMAELASYNSNTNSGISKWVESGTTKKIAFLCGWAYFIENIFYLPMLAGRVPVFASWITAPISDLTSVVSTNGNVDGVISSEISPIIYVVITLIVLLLCMFISLYFEKIFDKVGIYIGIVSLTVAFGFIILTLLSVPLAHQVPAYSLSYEHLRPTLSPVTLSSLVWIIFAIGGVETMGSVVNEIDNPSKRLPKIVIMGAILVISAYALGIMGLSFILTPEQLSSGALENAMPIMFAQLFISYGLDNMVGVILFKTVIFSQIFITITALVLWFVATINVLFLDIEVGIFPKIISKKNKSNKPINATIFTFLLIVLFILISNMKGFSNIYTVLYDMSTITVVIPFMLLLISYFNFKRKGKKGAYEFIKNKTLSLSITMFLIIITLIAFVFGVLDPSLYGTPEFLTWFEVSFGGVVFFMIFGYAIYERKNNRVVSNIIYMVVLLLLNFIIGISTIIILLDIIIIAYLIYDIMSIVRQKKELN